MGRWFVCARTDQLLFFTPLPAYIVMEIGSSKHCIGLFF